MASQIRVDERRDACADLLVDLTSDMNHILTERWDADMILEIAGPASVPLWIKFNPAQLSSHLDYEVKVDPDTSLPLTKQMREQKAMMVFQGAKDDPFIEQWNLRKWVLNEMYGVDADFLLKPREQIQQEQAMQQQLAMSVPQAAEHLRNIHQKKPGLSVVGGGGGR
jgi:hypothetical protein